MNYFSELGLSQTICEVLEQLGFEKPTPIQEQAIPLLLQHHTTDFIGLAQTGTGKTAAFGLPLIELMNEDQKTTQAIIMSPTRELGQQTAKQIDEFVVRHKKLNVEVVYGGVDITRQIKALKKPTQIVVATPGRLIDLMKRKAISLSDVKYVVLDEADEMLNMGFKEDIDEIISHTQEDRAIWLFSATMPREIRGIIDKYMSNPHEVSVDAGQKSNKDISHEYVVTKSANKLAAVRRFLDIQPDMRGIMFCRTKRETQEIADQFSTWGYGVEALHGDLSQNQRDAVMKRFKSRSMQLLIATDVAARGIDVNDLTHVFHHTLPDQLDSYTHRSGRTGRAGKKGISLAFINPREGRKIKDLERKIKVNFELVEVPNKKQMKYSRLNHWSKLILQTKVAQDVEEIIANLDQDLVNLSQKELLERLITLQLDHLSTDGAGGEPNDLNEETGQAQRNEERNKPSDPNADQRFFINVGEIDGVTKADLIHFVTDVANIDSKKINQVDVKKNCSFFYVDKAEKKGFAEKFDGIMVNERAIRVNEDHDGPPQRRPRKEFNHGGGGASNFGRKRRNDRPKSRSRRR